MTHPAPFLIGASNNSGGCTKWSPGCANCYAETYSKRYKWDIWGSGKPRRVFDDKHNSEPLNWNREAMAEWKRHTVFCGSMMDWCDKEAPPGEREKMWPLIRKTPFLMWLLLTKRVEYIADCLPKDWWDLKNGIPIHYTNVALGVSIERDDFSWRATELAKIPAYARFISAEPLLGPLPSLVLDGIDWLIVGYESGIGYRTGNKAWASELRDKCKDTTFFYKQSNGRFSGTDPYLDGKEYKSWPQKFSLPVV